MHIQEFSHSGLRKLQIAQAVALPVWTTSTLNRLRQGKCSPLESLKQPLLMDEKGGLVLTDHSPTNGWLIWSYPNKPISSTNGSLIYDTNLSTNLKIGIFIHQPMTHLPREIWFATSKVQGFVLQSYTWEAGTMLFFSTHFVLGQSG